MTGFFDIQAIEQKANAFIEEQDLLRIQEEERQIRIANENQIASEYSKYFGSLLECQDLEIDLKIKMGMFIGEILELSGTTSVDPYLVEALNWFMREYLRYEKFDHPAFSNEKFPLTFIDHSTARNYHNILKLEGINGVTKEIEMLYKLHHPQVKFFNHTPV